MYHFEDGHFSQFHGNNFSFDQTIYRIEDVPSSFDSTNWGIR